MNLKTMPVWAGAMVSNFKRMYREKHSRDTTLTNDQIWTVLETVFDDEDPAHGDVLRVDAMLTLETEGDI